MTREEVLSEIEARDVKFIRLWFTDILGQLKSFSVTRTDIEDALDGGMGFDGSSITGFNRIEESDMIAMPDTTTFTVLPYRPSENAVARMFCDVQRPSGDPFEGDPRRNVLSRVTPLPTPPGGEVVVDWLISALVGEDAVYWSTRGFDDFSWNGSGGA